MEHRTAFGLFLALAVNRPAAVASINLPAASRGARARALSKLHTAAVDIAVGRSGDNCSSDLIDVDANLLHADLSSDIDHHIQVKFLIEFGKTARSIPVSLTSGHVQGFTEVLLDFLAAPHDTPIARPFTSSDRHDGWSETIRGAWQHCGG